MCGGSHVMPNSICQFFLVAVSFLATFLQGRPIPHTKIGTKKYLVVVALHVARPVGLPKRCPNKVMGSV